MSKYGHRTHNWFEAIVNKIGGEEKAEAFLRNECELMQMVEPKPRTDLLEFISTVVIPATATKFVFKDKFVVNTKPNAPVKISYLGAWILKGYFKIEDLGIDTTLRYYKLRNTSMDRLIIEELGGEAKAETTLSGVFSLMVGQKHGESGVLLTNGYANLFYIRDITGDLCTIVVRWNVVGWKVDVESVDRQFSWVCGSQVFSRNSDL